MSKFIQSTINKTVLFSNERFGEKLFTHIHLDNDTRLDTVSLFFRLTENDKSFPNLILYDALKEDNRILTKGYMDFRKLTYHEKTSKDTKQIPIEDFLMVKFNASIIPHSFTYNKDLWVTMVYDHVVLKNIDFNHMNGYSVLKLNTLL